jgi:hypothetical protein
VRGLLRCGLCGEPMDAVRKATRTPGEWYEVYVCSGRRRRLPFQPAPGVSVDGEPPAVCPQRPVKRALIDGPVWEFFRSVGLDLEATCEAVVRAHGSKAAELRALREQAEREAQRAEDRLARVRRDYQDGRLAADDWTEQRGQLSAEATAAAAEAARFEAQEQALDARALALDAEGAVLRELASIRALVAGQAQERSAESLDAFRAALLRLFESFTLTHTGGIDFSTVEPLRPGEVARHVEHPALVLAPAGGSSLLPRVREEAVMRWEWDRGVDFPVLRKLALNMGDADLSESTCRGGRRRRGRSSAPGPPPPPSR